MGLAELMLHLDKNRRLKSVPGLKEHFWDMVIVDILIDNSDRNNGNWGLVFNGEVYKIAPVYDNGNAFSSKTSDERIRELLKDMENLEKVVKGSSVTIYEIGGHVMSSMRLLQQEYPALKNALIRNVPTIGERMDAIMQMIDKIPESYEGITICSEYRKRFYKAGLKIRYEKMLLPALERVKL